MTSVQFEFNTPEDVNIEMQLLAQALTNVVRAEFPPKKELVNKAIQEMEHQQGCGLPIK